MGNKEEKNYCVWIPYDIGTMIPKSHDAQNPYWRIPIAWDNIKYCPYCGKRIKLVK